MITTILSHEVKNYDIWKKEFDKDVENLSNLGLNITGVFKSVNKPKMITLICEIPTEDVIISFNEWSKLKNLMRKGSIKGKPEIKILYKI